MNETAFTGHADSAVDEFDLDITYTVQEADAAQAGTTHFPYTTTGVCI